MFYQVTQWHLWTLQKVIFLEVALRITLGTELANISTNITHFPVHKMMTVDIKYLPWQFILHDLLGENASS